MRQQGIEREGHIKRTGWIGNKNEMINKKKYRMTWLGGNTSRENGIEKSTGCWKEWERK